MKTPIVNLVLGLLLLGLAVFTGSTWFISGHVPVSRLVLTLALLLFAVSRLMRFKAPESQLIRAIRMIALASLILSLFMKGNF